MTVREFSEMLFDYGYGDDEIEFYTDGVKSVNEIGYPAIDVDYYGKGEVEVERFERRKVLRVTVKS